MQAYIFVFLHGPSARMCDLVTCVVLSQGVHSYCNSYKLFANFLTVAFFVFSDNMKTSFYLVSSLPDVSRIQRVLIGKNA